MDENYSGVLLIGHGMRDASGTRAFFEIVEQVRMMLPKMPVEGAFLQFAQPTIAEAVARLAGQGGANIAAVPMFLSAFGHTSDDIPVAISQAIRNLPDIKVYIKQPVGTHQRVVELSALRFQQSLIGHREIPVDKTLLIIAAHGSTEPEAIEELTNFAARREKLTPVGRVEPCFAVLGKPQLADVLKQSVLSSYKRIAVQPHLLLPGRYHDMIRNQVETFRREYLNIDWIVTEPLGPDRLLAQAVVEMMKVEGERGKGEE